MKKFLFIILFSVCIADLWGQCLTAPYGQYPSVTFNPTCNSTYIDITTCGYRGEYSVVSVISGNQYSFQSSASTDFITISTTAPVAIIYGTGTVNWTATFTGNIRFYTHGNATCATGTGCRTKRVRCLGIPSPCLNVNGWTSASMPTTVVPSVTSNCFANGQYADEYSTWTTGLLGVNYTFSTSIATDWITVRVGTWNGTVVAFGNQPLTFVAPSNNTYYVHVNTNSFCVQDALCRNITMTRVSALPVQLLSFNANCEEVFWKTASETNSDYFLVESSFDGENWNVVDSVAGAGNSSSEIEYSVTLKKRGGVSYYRLKQFDTDGKFEVYSPVSVECSLIENYIKVYPNPTNGKFVLEIYSEEYQGIQEILVTDGAGKTVKQRKIEVKNGTTVINLSLDIADGIYFLSLYGLTEKIKIEN